ncbi:hypothetical protein [Streptomyces decoyicus]|uniref:hypothetical protein n=1 Tax=Streptomyces decoyicus TaxID=249567 RepID=UPI0038650E55
MTVPTRSDDDQGRPVPQQRMAWVPAAVALMCGIGIVLLIVTGHLDAIPAVAAFGGAALTGGAIAQVTINVTRR